MRRFLVIFLIFTLLASIILMSSCNESDSCTCVKDHRVPTYCGGELGVSCVGESCDKEVEVSGCHINNNCIDCYWFPFLFGCYKNDLNCMLFPSCVVFGFDFTLLEFYSYNIVDMEPTDIEKRNVVKAVEGVDYIIDSVIIMVDDKQVKLNGNHLGQGGLNGENIKDDISTILGLIMLYREAEIKFFVEYTVLTELNLAELHCEFEYDGLDFSKNLTRSVTTKVGNVPESYGDPNYISKNIKPGKHIITATASLNMYEILALENMTNFYFVAYTYEN